MEALDLRGLVPAAVTPFTRDGEVDHSAIQRLGSWLGGFKGVKGLVVLGHAHLTLSAILVCLAELHRFVERAAKLRVFLNEQILLQRFGGRREETFPGRSLP